MEVTLFHPLLQNIGQIAKLKIFSLLFCLVQFLIYIRAIINDVHQVDMKNILKLITVVLLIGVVSSCFKKEESTIAGILSGNVILEPMCPDEPCDLGPKDLEALFEPRKVIIYSSDTSEVIQNLSISIDGTFATALPVGDYIIDINHYENDISPDVPSKLTIANGFTATKTIHIATGL